MEQQRLNKDEIVNYIEKLKQIESDLSSGETEDMSFLNDLNELLGKLNTEFNEQSFNSSSDLIVRVKRLHPNAVIPSYAKLGDAGMDLTITSVISETITKITYGFGISLEIPRGYVGLIFPRSSVRKYELSLSNSVGVIDSGFRGEIEGTFNKLHDIPERYNIGDRAAQIIIIPFPRVNFIESDTLTDSDRGSGGFGSSGK